MPTTRVTLRSSLQRKTANQLTASPDLDTILNLAWEFVQGDWMKFDPGMFRNPVRQSATTSSTGILEVNASTTRLERAEDSNEVKYHLIDNIDDINDKTGYFFAGYDTTSNVREIRFIDNGNSAASVTIQFYEIRRVDFGSGDSAEPSIPEEYRDLIAIKAAELWHQDQGAPMQRTAELWESRYGRRLKDAKDWYKNVTKDVTVMPTTDPEAGGLPIARHITD